MPQKVKLKAYVHKYGDSLTIHSSDMSEYGFILVGPGEFEYEVPADFNPVAAEVAGLNKQLDKLADTYQEQKQALQSRINDLLCLEAPAAVAADDEDRGWI